MDKKKLAEKHASKLWHDTEYGYQRYYAKYSFEKGYEAALLSFSRYKLLFIILLFVITLILIILDPYCVMLISKIWIAIICTILIYWIFSNR